MNDTACYKSILADKMACRQDARIAAIMNSAQCYKLLSRNDSGSILRKNEKQFRLVFLPVVAEPVILRIVAYALRRGWMMLIVAGAGP
jgi:hypothetical protein